ncbi:hypothetical protein B0H13DRAFT_2669015 [Mycena leptocephala]|nr:hypothetical protein B0H13DRAFT_2669015 [Mycena leptocephala]
MPYTTTGVPSRADDPKYHPRCTMSVPGRSSNPARLPPACPVSAAAVYNRSRRLPRLLDARIFAYPPRPSLPHSTRRRRREWATCVTQPATSSPSSPQRRPGIRKTQDMDSTVGSPMASLIPSDDADSPTNIDAFLYLLTQTLSLFSD